MWRLKPLSSSIQLSSKLPTKYHLPAPAFVRLKGNSLSQKQDVRYLWYGVKNYQAGSQAVKLKTDNVFHEGQEIEGFTVTEVSCIFLRLQKESHETFHVLSGLK